MSQAVLKLDGYNLKDQCISVAISNPPARSQKSVHKDVAMDTAYTPALGGGKKVMGLVKKIKIIYLIESKIIQPHFPTNE